MNTFKNCLIVFVVGILSLGRHSVISYAHDGKEHSHDHGHHHPHGENHDHHHENSWKSMSTDALIAQLRSEATHLGAAIEAKDATGLHTHAEAVVSLSATLEERTIGADKRTAGTLRNIKRAASSLHDAGDGGKLDQASIYHERLLELLKLLGDQTK